MQPMYTRVTGLLAGCVLALSLSACATRPVPAPTGGSLDTFNSAGGQTDALAQTGWILARWTQPGGAARAVPAPGARTQPITLFFTRERGRAMLSGNAGCNRYSGQYALANGQLIVPYPPVTTRMACPTADGMKLEQDFLSALAAISSSRLDSDTQPGRLTLVLNTGDVLEFNRGPDPVAGALP